MIKEYVTCHTCKGNGVVDRYLFMSEREIDRYKPKTKCEDCGSKKDLHRHHIISLKDGGNNHIDNLKILCQYCHDRYHYTADRLNFIQKVRKGTKRGLKKAKENGVKLGRPKGSLDKRPRRNTGYFGNTNWKHSQKKEGRVGLNTKPNINDEEE